MGFGAVPKAIAVSQADGSVKFHLKFVQPPGLHQIRFQVEPLTSPCGGTGDPVPAVMMVQVRRCTRGGGGAAGAV